jgi:hypothetical protein
LEKMQQWKGDAVFNQPNGLDLVHAVVLNHLIDYGKQKSKIRKLKDTRDWRTGTHASEALTRSVEIVEEINHLHRGRPSCDGCESDNVAGIENRE